MQELEETDLFVLAVLSFDNNSISSSSSISPAPTSLSPSPSLSGVAATSPVAAAIGAEVGTASCFSFPFPLALGKGEEARERGSEEVRDGKVAGEEGLLELRTCVFLSRNVSRRTAQRTWLNG